MTERHDRFIGNADDVIIEDADGRAAAIREYGETGDRSVLVRAGLAPERTNVNAQDEEHSSVPLE